ncbi:MAG: fumarate hydratase [Acidobacteriota bacterium]
MREIESSTIIEDVSRACIEANNDIGEDMVRIFQEAFEKEESESGKDVLRQLIENAKIAKEEWLPYCQDTGFAVFFVELGQDVHIKGATLEQAINEGVRRGYKEGYLRASIVSDPLRRKNTGDNTPAIIHIRIVEGDRLKITMAAKGGGSENMSRIAMLKPSDGKIGVENFVVDTVSSAGPNACPPLVVGVGIGGTMEMATILAKKAAVRAIGSRNLDPYYAAMEEELEERCNRLGVGPMGLGGRITVLKINIETHPCHIASLPVAVNINCHAARHKEIVL